MMPSGGLPPFLGECVIPRAGGETQAPTSASGVKRNMAQRTKSSPPATELTTTHAPAVAHAPTCQLLPNQRPEPLLSSTTTENGKRCVCYRRQPAGLGVNRLWVQKTNCPILSFAKTSPYRNRLTCTTMALTMSTTTWYICHQLCLLLLRPNAYTVSNALGAPIPPYPNPRNAGTPSSNTNTRTFNTQTHMNMCLCALNIIGNDL